MTTENQNYKLEILEYAVNQSLNRLLPENSQDALSVILDRSNEVVWRVATDIYVKSGHQIDFVFIRDILNLRIEPLQNKIAEEERIKEELEAQKRIREAEEAPIRAKLEAERLAREAKEQKQLQQFKEANPDIDIDNYRELEIFTKLKKIIAEQLQVDEKLITLNYVLDFNFSYFGSNEDAYLNFIEFVMAIEEEFDIEIPDEEAKSLLFCSLGKIINFVLHKV